MNFLHFAVALFVISSALLVVVSLATAPDTLAKLRGLTFKTLESSYIVDTPGAHAAFRIHVVASVALAATVIGLWIHFA